MAEPAFTPTKSFGQLIQFDDNSRSFRILRSNARYSYDDLAGWELVEDNGRPKGMARAFSLGFLSSGQPVNALSLVLRLRSSERPASIQLLITPTRTDTLLYKNLRKTADSIMEEFVRVCPNAPAAQAPLDYTDEIRRLGRLRDEGLLTDGEFEQKKKQLLGL